MTAPKLAHVVLQTNRLEEMRDWYCALLQARVVYENDTLCFITFDEEHHRLAFLRPPGQKLIERTPLTVGVQHTAYTFPDLPCLLSTFQTLHHRGIEPFLPIQHGVTTSLYYQDPDGNLAELQVDNFADPEAATAYMLTSTEYAEDPIGPEFDPFLMAKALDGGAAVDEVTTRAWALAAGAPTAGRP